MTQNELDTLKARADQMGITYKNNIGIEALKAKINAKLDDKEDTTDEEGNPLTSAPAAAPQETPAKKSKHELENEIRQQQQAEMMAMKRVRITCLNPAKRELKGEIITVANRYLGTVRKFIPFGEATDNGFHVPQVLLQELQSRKFNSVSTKPGQNGQVLPVQRLVNEFSIEELEPLTEKELAKLAATQMAAAGVE